MTPGSSYSPSPAAVQQYVRQLETGGDIAIPIRLTVLVLRGAPLQVQGRPARADEACGSADVVGIFRSTALIGCLPEQPVSPFGQAPCPPCDVEFKFGAVTSKLTDVPSGATSQHKPRTMLGALESLSSSEGIVFGGC